MNWETVDDSLFELGDAASQARPATVWATVAVWVAQ
jgi:hypothetical protein